jgi:hypothetical protein
MSVEISGPEAEACRSAGAVPRDKTFFSVLPIFLTSEGIEHGTCGSKMKRKGLLVFCYSSSSPIGSALFIISGIICLLIKRTDPDQRRERTHLPLAC